MSLELPASPGPRSPGARPKGRGRIALALLVAALGLVGLVFAILIAPALFPRPRLELLEPSLGEPGGEVTLVGRNFGSSRGDSRIDVDGIVPTASSYLLWSDSVIRLRLPASFDSGLLHVVTRNGRSNPKLFMNRGRLPILALGGRPLGAPYIASISPDEGPIGSLISLAGQGFGESRGSARVFFAWTAEGAGNAPPGDQAAPTTISPPESDLGYELWSDKELRIRIPDGAISGSVYVVSDKGRSNAVFLHVSGSPGAKAYSARTSFSISQTVSLSRIRTSGPAELYLWTPLPVQSASQRLVRNLGQEPQPIVEEYRGTSIFRLAGLSTGRDRAVTQSFLVQTFAVEATVDSDRGPARLQNPPALIAAYSGPDVLVPSSAPAIQGLARKICGGERGSWRSARLVWDWLGKNLKWTDRHEHTRVLDSLADGSADSWSYAIVACALLRASGLPCQPVAGYLVDPSRKAARHYWVEIYLYGLGWVPLDPILGSGASPDGIRAPWQDRSRYFGGLDARHIAFSRGYTALAPMSPDGRRVSKARRWSFQSFYEEASGALDAYSSFWGDIEVTGMY